MYNAVPGARPLLVRLPFRVQTYDIDYAGHVNNAVYIRWLEDLRTEFMDQHYGIARVVEENLAPVIHATHIVYHKPLLLLDRPEGRMWCAKIGRATMTLEAEIGADGTLHAAATQRAILLRYGTVKPARIPAEMLDKFASENKAL